VLITIITALVLGAPHNVVPVPSPIGPDAATCVYVIPIATPGAWMCPPGVTSPEAP